MKIKTLFLISFYLFCLTFNSPCYETLNMLSEIKNVSEIREIKSLNYFNVSIDFSSSNKYLFFSCTDLKNKSIIIFGKNIEIKNNIIQFFYDLETKKINFIPFKYCYSIFSVYTWYDKDNILFISNGTSQGRGIALYNYKVDKIIIESSFQGKVYFSQNRNYLVFNSIDPKRYLNAPYEAYYKYITIINLFDFRITTLKPKEDDYQFEFGDFIGNDKIIYSKYILDSGTGNKLFNNENDKKIIFSFK